MGVARLPEILVLDVAEAVWPEASEFGEVNGVSLVDLCTVEEVWMVEDAVLLWVEGYNPLEELDMGVIDESVETIPVNVDDT